MMHKMLGEKSKSPLAHLIAEQRAPKVESGLMHPPKMAAGPQGPPTMQPGFQSPMGGHHRPAHRPMPHGMRK